ncbi:MAG: DNA recombination protein RmuC [Intestinibaculum porci]|uniref:DNA recombination protein RmuC n=1 Tax=Intestinibaculum porci TaxID=2487118 RepID=UPI000EDA3E0C|nr:DNA recombination protein RmuC [Erysipelotrichaceae bacterium]
MMYFLLFALIIACVLIIFMLYTILQKMNDGHRFDRLEQGLLNNRHELVENKAVGSSLSKNYEMMLKELMKTKESLAVNANQLQDISHNIHDMNAIMVNTKKRGNFGEYQLYYLLSMYLGENEAIYEKQYHLSNGKIGDAALHLPGSSLVMIIDSKFPSENYLRLVDDPEDIHAVNEFRQNVKKHIKDISEKYILTGITSEEAIMFIPSEAIYLYICQNEPSLMEEAHRAHVLMTSPSTLMGVCMTLVNITKDYQRSQNIEKIEKLLIAMKDDSERMMERYSKVQKSSATLQKQIDEMGISVDKIDHRIHQLYDGKE